MNVSQETKPPACQGCFNAFKIETEIPVSILLLQAMGVNTGGGFTAISRFCRPCNNLYLLLDSFLGSYFVGDRFLCFWHGLGFERLLPFNVDLLISRARCPQSLHPLS